MPAALAPNEVPRVQTFTTRDQMVGVFANEWRLRYGGEATAEILSILAAHWAIETGRGKSMYNWNPGNMTTHSGDYYINGDPKYHYKAYKNVADGVDGLLDWVWNHPDVRAALRSGDAQGYGHALKQAHYYEADEATYSNSLARIAAEYLPAIQALMHPVSGIPPWPSDWRLVVALTPAVIAQAKSCLRTLKVGQQETCVINGKMYLFAKQRANGKTVVTAWEPK